MGRGRTFQRSALRRVRRCDAPRAGCSYSARFVVVKVTIEHRCDFLDEAGAAHRPLQIYK